jgi:hypothetical protein
VFQNGLSGTNRVDALKAEGDGDVQYVELQGVGQGAVVPAFGEPKLLEWLVKQRRAEMK